MSKTITVQKGLSVLSILGIILVVFKLLGVASLANTSWFLVLLPFYIGPLAFFAVLALMLVLFLVYLLLAFIAGIIGLLT